MEYQPCFFEMRELGADSHHFWCCGLRELELRSEIEFWWGLVKVGAQSGLCRGSRSTTTSHTSLHSTSSQTSRHPRNWNLQIQASQLIMASENESASDSGSGSRGAKRVRTDSNPAPPVKKDEDGEHPPIGFFFGGRRKADESVTDSSSDDGIGPTLPPAGSAVKKKRRTLPHEKLYLGALPTAGRYSKSLMHRDNLAFVTMTPFTDFLITTSVEGVVKFWKKVAVGIEFVKMFRAHQGEIVSVSVSTDGRSFATAGADKRVAIFDVVTFGTLVFFSLESSKAELRLILIRSS